MGGKKDRANGADRSGWDAAAKASAEREAAEKPKGKRKSKAEQMRLKVDSRDAVHIPAKHELRRDMTEAEWDEQAALLASNGTDLQTIEAEIATLKTKHKPEIKRLKKAISKGQREVNAREWLTLTDCIEVHDVNTRTVTVFADVNGEPGVEVIPARKMRDDEYERALKSAPFEPPDDDDDAPPVMDPPADEAT